MALFLFLCFLFSIIVSQAKAGDPVYCDSSRGNYTTNSIYDNNLKTVLSSFYSHTEINYGFYNFSYGQDPDKAYAIGVCRGDVKPNDCRRNLNNSIGYLREQCPNQKEAIVWAGDNTLWYSSRSIFGIVETNPTQYLIYERDASNADEYPQALSNLMGYLLFIAASGDSRQKYAADSLTLNDPANFATIYAYVQCMPDLSQQECTTCLFHPISEIQKCCNGRMGGNIFKPSCRIRFEPYRFFNSTILLDSPSLPPSPSTNNTSLGNNKRRTVIATAVPIVAVVLVLILIWIYLRHRKPKTNYEANMGKYDDGGDEEMTIAESLQFNFDIIKVATSDFSHSNKLGQGGFGIVYRGKLPNGQMIAVKRLSTNSDQGDVEFKNEVILVAKLQHRNLVRLLGFCLEGKERLLVYEFVPNKSLDYFIFDPTRKTQLNWETRYTIIKGIARGILYLHEDSRLRIIHRDLKASNILLDDEMNPKISDFGLARLFVIGQTEGSTNRIVGTYGYMAPEYAMHGEFSVKSDVFSFGVLVLEIITGHKNSANICHGEDVEYLLTYAWRSWREGKAINIIDPSLSNFSQDEIMRCIHISLLCIQENVVDRPTMASVALMLNSYSLALSIPSKPAYFMGGGIGRLPDMQQQVDNVGATRLDESVNQISITDPYPR
ncbi:putative receptor-like protein kinase At4g00960 [Trifolium pratense]|uniref:putative receptor-like protein kinase At4g00960 n=1 Tax=Trifolium pratense TaxID=57577 RepID=UPI001E693980|nr:putative receptor-like protein kinase At4g00960 [Trifolium pratense]